MKTVMSPQPRASGAWLRAKGWLLGAMAGLAALTAMPGHSQTVATVGGGRNSTNSNDFGYADGDTFLNSQFNFPSGLTLNPAGSLLYVADRNNNAIRFLNLSGNTTATFTTLGLNQPAGVAVDSLGFVYVANEGNNNIVKFDSNRNLVTTWVGLASPTAITLDSAGNLYVTEMTGSVRRITNSAANAAPSIRQVGEHSVLLATNLFSGPRGIAIRDDGQVAVADTGNHCIRLINPANGVISFLTLPNGPGYTDGGTNVTARLNFPHGLARAGNNALVVADRSNQRVRTVTVNGTLGTLYGIDPLLWPTDPAQFPGWFDGDKTVAEAREPYGVTVDGGGNVFASEVFYHIIRKITATGLAGAGGTGDTGNGGGGNTNVVVVPPSLSFVPNSGYFPMGQTITVSSTSPTVYYTTDGTEPTTNSLRLTLVGNTGTIIWKNSTNDLTALRLKAFASDTVFTNVSGVPAAATTISVPSGLSGPIVGGNGSTIIVPVVLNIKPTVVIKSINFNVEIQPNGGAPMISAEFGTLGYDNNDFIQLTTSDMSGGGSASFDTFPYISPDDPATRGLVISFIGANANYSVSRFGAVALLRVPIPPNAAPGQTYTVRVRFPSATSDAIENPVEITAGGDQSILVQATPYTVGDTAPRGWYNAGDFGNGNINNNDVNNVFNASLGIRVPFPFTDAFDAMDVYPEDTALVLGGDGAVDFLDWQTVLMRSSRINQNNFVRTRNGAGALIPATTILNGQASTPASVANFLPGEVWNRQVLIGATPVQNATAGTVVNVPVYIKVTPGSTVSGLQFRAAVIPENGAPPITQPVSFAVANGFASPSRYGDVGPSEIAPAWSLSVMNLASGSSNVVGSIRFTIPAEAASGQYYRIRFVNASGATGSLLNSTARPYSFESRPGFVWLGPAGEAPGLFSDEWKKFFFGSENSPEAAPNGDADGDGIPNWQEFLAGTNPKDAQSKLVISSAENRPDAKVALKLLTAPGKMYVLEYVTDLLGNGTWTPVSTNLGNGDFQEFLQNSTSGKRFYRVRIQQ